MGRAWSTQGLAHSRCAASTPFLHQRLGSFMEPHDPRPAAVSGKEGGEDDAQRSTGGAEDLERKRGCACRGEGRLFQARGTAYAKAYGKEHMRASEGRPGRPQVQGRGRGTECGEVGAAPAGRLDSVKFGVFIPRTTGCHGRLGWKGRVETGGHGEALHQPDRSRW